MAIELLSLPDKNIEPVGQDGVANQPVQPKSFDPQQEGVIETVNRNLQRTVGEIGSGVFGAPGNVYSLARSLANPVFEKVTGYEDVLPDLGIATSEELREQFKEKYKPLKGEGYFEPQGTAEEFISRGAQEIGDYALPSLAGGGGAAKLATRILKPVVGSTLADLGARLFGVGPGGQKTARAIGSLAPAAGEIVFGLVAPSYLQNKGNQLIQAAEENAPNKLFKSSKLTDAINKKQEEIMGLVRTPGSKEATELINDIKSLGFQDKMPAKKLVELSKALNVEYNKRSPSAQSIVDVAQSAIKDIFKPFSKSDANFVEPFLEGKNLLTAYHNSYKVGDVIKKIPKLKYLAGYPIFKALSGDFGGIGKLAKVGAIGGSALSGVNVLKNMALYPSTRKLYGNVVKNALSGNKEALTRNFIKLNDVYNKKYNVPSGKVELISLPTAAKE